MEATANNFAVRNPVLVERGVPVSGVSLSNPKVASEGVSIVIPAYNEEARLDQTLTRYLSVFERGQRPFEIIVVVDGVRDHTADVARRFANRRVRVLEFAHRLGKGGAIKAGIQRANYEYVGYVDADGPVPASDIFRMVDALDTSDCVIASRWVRGSNVVIQQPVTRVVMGRVWNMMARAVLLLPIKDTQCGAKFFRRSAILPVLKSVSITNWAFDAGLLYHLKRLGRTFSEVPVTWQHDSDSHLNPGKEVPTMFLSILAVRFMSSPVACYVPRSLVQRFSLLVNES